VRVGEVRELCALDGAPDTALDGLLALALARASRAGSWQEDFVDILLPGFGLYVDIEAAATTLQAYDPELIHGLLQAPDYARAVIEGEPDIGKSQRAQRLEVLLARQRAVLDRDPPLRVTHILGEAALTRVIGSPEVMTAQLAHLTTLTTLTRRGDLAAAGT
jgi:hypothetical protein